MDRVWNYGEIDKHTRGSLLDLPSFGLCILVAGGEDSGNSNFKVGDGTPQE